MVKKNEESILWPVGEKKKEKAAWGKISCGIPKTPCAAVVACPWHYQSEEKESICMQKLLLFSSCLGIVL